MKKLTLIVCLLASTLFATAKVYYLLPGSTEENSPVKTVLYYLPEEYDGLGTAQSNQVNPERKAHAYFTNTFAGGQPITQCVTIKDVKDGLLLSNGKIGEISTLWINVDRVGLSLSDFDIWFDNAFCTALGNFVKAGGNVYLSKQATRLVTKIGRCTWWPKDFANGGYETASNEWQMCYHFCTDGNIEKHACFKHMKNCQTQDELEFCTRYPLTSGSGNYRRTDNNSLWNDWSNYGITAGGCSIDRRNGFENAQTCKILGGYGHTRGLDAAGLIEFYPSGDYQGTVIAMGLAAYQWGSQNTSEYNVENLTKGILEYLDPTFTWNAEPQDGLIGASATYTASCTAASSVKYYTSDASVVNIDENTGQTYLNYFGTATITAKAFYGDRCIRQLNKTITVSGGNPATFGYVLPYSLHTMSGYDNEEGLRPDYEAAAWFYTNYVAGGTGFFIKPSELGNYVSNANLKCLWIHNDHVGLESATYYADLGGDGFKTNLTTLLANGKNVFVSKQATRLVGDLGRNDYPSYSNGGYAQRDAWAVGNHWFADADAVDHSTHAVYANLGQNPALIAAGNHTDNNDVWSNFGSCAATAKCRLEDYQTAHNCLILGGWGHNTNLECAGFVEYYPTETQNGTLIAMGLAAYHWANPTDNIKKLTQNVLYYLSLTDAPAFTWTTEPQNGYVGGSMQLAVEAKAAKLVYSTSDNTKATVSATGLLQYLAEGNVEVRASYVGDGYLLPKNVQSASVAKSISISPISFAWAQAPVNGVVGGTCQATVAKSPDVLTVKYFSTNNDIAAVADDGTVYYNYPGTCTISADLMDGEQKLQSISQEITISTGNPEGPFAYLLVSSLNQLPAETYNEVDQKPDYNAAKFFYDQYIAGIGAGAFSNAGCFVTPDQMGSLDSKIKVLWINIDRVDLASNNIITSTASGGLGLDATFQSALRSFINAGNNVLLTKQATRLLGDLGRLGSGVYPSYNNGGYDAAGNAWFVGNKWFTGDDEIDHSTHAMFGSTINPQLMAPVVHTNNNCIIEGSLTRQALLDYESTKNCRILGDWYNNETTLDCAGFVEYYPQDGLNGTIVMLGLAAYQWTTANTCDYMKTLTKNILYYLDQSEAPAFGWGAVPDKVDLSAGAQTYSLEVKNSGVRWTSSDESVATVEVDPEDINRVIITPLKLGTTTITATRYGDGYNLPKNISEKSIYKTLTVENASCGTCFPVTF